jgi:hypothetical protein
MTTRKRQAPERSSKVVRALTAFARAKKGAGDEGEGEDAGDGDPATEKPAEKPADTPAAAEAAPRPAPAPVEEAPAPAPPRPAPVAAAADDDPYTPLPDPKSVVPGDPDASEPPPRRVPPGDSRSMRRGHGPTEEFALVYRNKSFLVTRVGVVGRRGRWRVIEYPSLGSASHAYAQECSRLVTEGFADYHG